MSKTEYVVVDHHHDKEAGYYKVTVGIPREVEEVERGPDGEPLQNLDEPQMAVVDNGDGTFSEKPLLGPDGEPIMKLGSTKTRKVVVYDAVEDFVFAADAKEWKGKSKEAIAKAQQAVVRDALFSRAKAAEKQAADTAAARSSLPGAGEAL